jgi:NAD(P)H dehydrogenase (quinone)
MRVLVVYSHPVRDSFGASVRDSAVGGLEAAGHEIRLTDLYAEGFEPVMSADERRTHDVPGVATELQRYADDLAWAQTLVLIYPTWWSAQPAMLKGWIDRVWICGVAWSKPETATRIKPELTNIRQIIAVTTHGSTKLMNSLEGEAGKRTVTRSLRMMCGRRTKTKWIALYGIDTSEGVKRLAFLDRVGRVFSKI